ncbi:hypothetical protein VTH82DRAFT_6511 [Thermothelomyces myriococcoides]
MQSQHFHPGWYCATPGCGYSRESQKRDAEEIKRIRVKQARSDASSDADDELYDTDEVKGEAKDDSKADADTQPANSESRRLVNLQPRPLIPYPPTNLRMKMHRRNIKSGKYGVKTETTHSTTRLLARKPCTIHHEREDESGSSSTGTPRRQHRGSHVPPLDLDFPTRNRPGKAKWLKEEEELLEILRAHKVSYRQIAELRDEVAAGAMEDWKVRRRILATEHVKDTKNATSRTSMLVPGHMTVLVTAMPVLNSMEDFFGSMLQIWRRDGPSDSTPHPEANDWSYILNHFRMVPIDLVQVQNQIHCYHRHPWRNDLSSGEHVRLNNETITNAMLWYIQGRLGPEPPQPAEVGLPDGHQVVAAPSVMRCIRADASLESLAGREIYREVRAIATIRVPLNTRIRLPDSKVTYPREEMPPMDVRYVEVRHHKCRADHLSTATTTDLLKLLPQYRGPQRGGLTHEGRPAARRGRQQLLSPPRYVPHGARRNPVAHSETPRREHPEFQVVRACQTKEPPHQIIILVRSGLEDPSHSDRRQPPAAVAQVCPPWRPAVPRGAGAKRLLPEED